MGKRRKTREHAFKLVYQIQINNDDINEQMDQYFIDNEVDNASKDYIKSAIRYINENSKDIDSVISLYLAKSWRIERIPKVELAIMRLAYYEIMNLDDVPKSVAINEAVKACQNIWQ